MPFHRCAYPTCVTLVRDGTGSRCPEHQAASEAERKAYDRARQADPFRIYATPAWRAFRADVLADRPWCVDCREPATDVDHLRTVRDRPDLAFEPTNVAPRCHRCHSARTAREQGWGRRPDRTWRGGFAK